MQVKITNNRKAPFGVEREDGQYRFVQPGETRPFKVRTVAHLEREPDIDVEIVNDLAPPPASLKAKAAKVGMPAKTPRRRRVRRKAPAR